MAIRQTLQAIIDVKDNASKKLRNISGGFSSMQKEVFQLAAGYIGLQQAISFIGDATRTFTEFEKEMRRVNTITRLGQTDFENMKKEVLELTKIVPFTGQELSTALFDIASAGVSAENQLAFLGQAAKVATAGVFDVKTAVVGLTAVIKGYGLAESDAVRVSDLFFKANELGQTTVGEMAQAIQQLTANSKASGVSLEQLFNVYATFTGVTGDANRVTTQFKGALNAIVKPTAEVRKKVDEFNKTHKETPIILGQSAFATQNLAEISRSLIEAVGGDQEALRKLIPEVEATNLIIAAGTDQFDTFNKKLGEMQDATGATEIAFAEMQQSIDNRTKLASAEIELFKIRAGGAFATIKLKIFEFMNAMISSAKVVKASVVLIVKSLGIVLSGAFRGLVLGIKQTGNWFIDNINKLLDKIPFYKGEGIKFRFDTAETEAGIANLGLKVDDLSSDLDNLKRAFIESGDGGRAEFDKFTDTQNKLKEALELSGGAADAFGSAASKAGEKAKDSFSKLTDKIVDFGEKSRDALADVTSKISDIQAKIQEVLVGNVKDNMSINQDLAEEYVKQEEKVADLRTQIGQETDFAKREQLKKTLEFELAELQKYGTIAIAFDNEVEEVRRRNSLSDIARAVEDLNKKRFLVNQEFEEKFKKLNAELDAEQQKFDKIKELQDIALKEADKFLAKGEKLTVESINREIEKWNQLAAAIARAKSGAQSGFVNVGAGVEARANQNVGSVNITITGNSFLDAQSAEKMGDLLIKTAQTNIRM